MHFLQLGKADCLPRQPLDPRPQGQVLPLDLLGVPLSNHMLIGGQMALVGTQTVGVEPGYSKRLQQFLQSQKNRVDLGPWAFSAVRVPIIAPMPLT